MDVARQVLRWFIPGLLLNLSTLGFLCVRFALNGNVLTVTEFARGNFGTLIAFLTALAGLGVPIGFIVYQVHYWLYWRVPLPFFKRPQDRGYSVLKDSRTDWQDLVGYPMDEQAHLEKGREIKIGKWRFYLKDRPLLERYEHNWRLATIAFYLVVQRSKHEAVAKQVEFLADMYHGLGATLVSVWLGYSSYLIYDIGMHRSQIMNGEVMFIIAGIVNFPVLVLLTSILRFNRATTLRALIELMHDTITAYERSNGTLRAKSSGTSNRKKLRGPT